MNNTSLITANRSTSGEVEVVYLNYSPDDLSLVGRFVRELVINGGLFDRIEDERVIQYFDYFRVSAIKGTGDNVGIDLYQLTGKSNRGEKIAMNISHYPDDNIARINFNNLNNFEVMQWFMNLDSTCEELEAAEKI